MNNWIKILIFFFKQKAAYEMRISDWSSDVCTSDLGPLDVPRIAAQLAAEGVGRIAVVSDEPQKYPTGGVFPPGTTVDHRGELDRVQREMRELAGVTRPEESRVGKECVRKGKSRWAPYH